MGDARRYDAWAMQIASGDWIGQDVFYQAPLYPYFLGSLYAIAGHSLLMVRVCQAVIGTAACVLLALAARRLYSERAGLIAGLGLALYAPAIFSDGLLQKTVLDLFFVCLVLWIISGLVDEPARRSRWFWLGMSLGGLALTRENALAIVGAILLVPPGRSQTCTPASSPARRRARARPGRRAFAGCGSQPNRRRRMASDNVAIRSEPLYRQQPACRWDVRRAARRQGIA